MATKVSPKFGFDVKDLSLADAGRKRIEWAFQSMPVLQTIRKQFIKTQPLSRVRLSACQDVTAETANLLIALRDGGGEVVLCGYNPLSTQDDVAAALVREYNIPTFAVRGESSEQRCSHIEAAVDHRPGVIVDAVGSLAQSLHTKHKDIASEVIGGTEETTSGLVRLRALAKEGVLAFPVIAVSDAQTKHLFDNRYGTGQSTIDGIIRATNFLLAGSTVVVAGYGWCGKAVALRARGLGANVVVTEVDPLPALEAMMDGFRVMSMLEAVTIGDVFVTVTGNKFVLGRDHFEKLKNGAILSNAGHLNVEIDLEALAKMASSRRQATEFVEEFVMRDGRRLYVLAEGRLVNLAAEGQPVSVMDMSFGNQALSIEYLVKHHNGLEKRVHSVPGTIDRQVARMKLESMGVKIDRLTPDQEEYLTGGSERT